MVHRFSIECRVSLKRFFFCVGVALGLGFGNKWADASPVIAAYQEVYKMNFEVCHIEGLPPGWHATFDGYPVAQVTPNHWVYGVLRQGSVILETSPSSAWSRSSCSTCPQKQ